MAPAGASAKLNPAVRVPAPGQRTSRAGSPRPGNGVPEYTADGLYELFAERRKGKESTVWPTISEVFGWQPASFDDFARRHAAIFRGEQPAPKV